MGEAFSAIIPRSKVYQSPNCGSMIALADGRIMWVWGVGGNKPAPYPMQANFSRDGGRTWSDPESLKLQDGSDLASFLGPSLVRLKSGKLGMVHEHSVDLDMFNQWNSRITVTFHTSSDEGKTWTRGIVVNSDDKQAHPYFDQLHQLSTGRLIVPFYRLVGPKPKGEALDYNYFTVFGEKFRNAYAYNMAMMIPYYSDDEGKTWQRSYTEVYASVDNGLGGNYGILEFGITELPDGRILMLGFSGLGRIYRSYSEDGGETWAQAEPTDLQASGPLSVKSIPERGHVLLIWCQGSKWEAMNGFPRHRLTCAITSDGGVTFEHFKNLESLDDVSRLEPEPLTAHYQRRVWRQPADVSRYHRAPGPLRVDHPFCTFHEGKAIIGYGMGTLGDLDFLARFYHTTVDQVCETFGFERDPKTDRIGGSNKICVVPVDWLYT